MELIYKIALTLIPRVGNIAAKTLISYSGSAEAVFKANKKELLKIPGIGRSTANEILNQKVLGRAETEVKTLEKYGIKALFYLGKDYPQRLKQYDDCPMILYFKGNTDLNRLRTISVVGTRKPSPHGIANTEELIDGLSAYKPLVISGLAFGVDIIAHRQSLLKGLDTVGIMGHGMHRIYPTEHRSTVEKMIHQGGILTEFPYGTQPNREHFPMRNRIIAAMCDALVVVETKKKGGSMISAEFASNYHKEVFAYPARSQDRHTGGNFLIKTLKAQLIEGPEDLAFHLNWTKENNPKAVQKQLFIDYSVEEKLIVDLLLKEEQIQIDKLAFLSKMPPGRLSSTLLQLEFKGVVKCLPGKRYMHLK